MIALVGLTTQARMYETRAEIEKRYGKEISESNGFHAYQHKRYLIGIQYYKGRAYIESFKKLGKGVKVTKQNIDYIIYRDFTGKEKNFFSKLNGKIIFVKRIGDRVLYRLKKENMVFVLIEDDTIIFMNRKISDKIEKEELNKDIGGF